MATRGGSNSSSSSGSGKSTPAALEQQHGRQAASRRWRAAAAAAAEVQQQAPSSQQQQQPLSAAVGGVCWCGGFWSSGRSSRSSRLAVGLVWMLLAWQQAQMHSEKVRETTDSFFPSHRGGGLPPATSGLMVSGGVGCKGGVAVVWQQAQMRSGKVREAAAGFRG